MAIKRKIGTIKLVANSTARVAVDSPKKHALYSKPYRATRFILAHVDPKLDVKVGDTVEIEETRPISKNKSWKILKVMEVTQ